jgi:hypothetical protein
MRQQLMMTMLIGVVGTLGCVAYINVATNTSPRPANYRAAVMRILDERRVDYRDVEVVDGCAPSYQLCRTYAGSVRVLAATVMLGRIDCGERWITCTLTVPQAAISDTPLDDVLDPVVARWDAIYGQLMLRLRELYRGKLNAYLREVHNAGYQTSLPPRMACA